MEKDRGTRIIAMMALFVAVVGVSIGFAAFNNELTIEPSASVTTDEKEFSVDFSSKASAINTLLNDTDNNVTTENGATVEQDTDGNYTVLINNESDSAPSISNLKANFTKPGQSVTFKFYAVNNGLYDAYLNAISMAKADTTNYMVCTSDDATQEILDAACETIDLEVKVGTETPLEVKGATPTSVTGTTDSITGHKLARNAAGVFGNAGEADTITVKITYKDVEGVQRVDGDFDVAFGKITLSYSSAD